MPGQPRRITYLRRKKPKKNIDLLLRTPFLPHTSRRLRPGPPSERAALPWLCPRHRERQGRWRRLLPMTAANCVSRQCFGKRPAVTPSWIIAWMRGRAAISAPRCAGAAMSLSVACPMLSSVKPGKSLSRDRYRSCRIVWPCSRRMWLVRLTPRLSRRRANSVCGSWQSCTRSCMARMTSALAKSWSAIN